MFNLLVSAFDLSAIFGNVLSHWYYYVALLVVGVGIFLLFTLKKLPPRNRLNRTQKLVYIAVLTALCTVANFITYYPVSYIAISFTVVVCFVAGYLLGARAGFLVGFIGDLIGAIIFPAGAYNPLIGLANGLSGVIVGVAFAYPRPNKYVKTIICAVLTLIICTAGINTFALWLMYGYGKKSFFAYLIVRLPWQTIMSALNCLICIGLIKILPRVLPKDKFNIQEDNKGNN